MIELEQPAGIGETRSLRILTACESELTKAIDNSIAFRTNQIQRAHGRDPNSQLSDFLEARAEIYHRMYGAAFNAKEGFDVVADASCFEMGEEIKIYVEPRRITLCGKANSRLKSAAQRNGTVDLGGNIIFRFLELGDEIDPSQARAEFAGCVVELKLPKVNAGRRAA